jgi:4-hydroxybenzoate polyprenyltransferase
MATLRALLVLGRVSNLPTVWSNCLAGWLLSGAGDWARFGLLCFGATCLYIGGMYLNDAFDAQFDQQHRPERPIPSGAIAVNHVWALGLGWVGVGTGALFLFPKTTIIFTLLLAVAILVYDAIHKIFAFSPVLMAACRLLLVLVAASAGDYGVTGLAIWSALVMAAYIIGLSYLARKESTVVSVRFWPCICLAAPLVLAVVVNWGELHSRVWLLCGIVALWMLRCLRFVFLSSQRNIGLCVSGLLAGIPLVDLLSVWEGSLAVAAVFFGLFGLALLFQRFIPAT